MAGKTPAQLFEHGLPICQALKANKHDTKVLLLAELTRLWRSVKVGDAKTWADQESLQDAVDDICELFPTLKVEEVLQCFKITADSIKLFDVTPCSPLERFAPPFALEAQVEVKSL